MPTDSDYENNKFGYFINSAISSMVKLDCYSYRIFKAMGAQGYSKYALLEDNSLLSPLYVCDKINIFLNSYIRHETYIIRDTNIMLFSKRTNLDSGYNYRPHINYVMQDVYSGRQISPEEILSGDFNDKVKIFVLFNINKLS